MKRIRVGLVGDFNKKMHTHVALNEAIEHCRKFLDFEVDAAWVPTASGPIRQEELDGIWIVPGSPYENNDSVYETIRLARGQNFPILGLCGGFQYMIVEYARNVLGLSEAAHGEIQPGSNHQVISRMSCSLKGKQEEVLIRDRQSWLYRVLGTDVLAGHFYCCYGVNPDHQDLLDQYPFVFTAFSPEGEARAFELKTHRFFKGTLFQPTLDSTPEKPNLLVLDFLKMLND